MLRKIALAIAQGSWVATGRKHKGTCTYQPHHTTGKKHVPGGVPGRKDHAFSLQASIMLENEMFLYIQILRLKQQEEAQKSNSPQTRSKQPFYLIQHTLKNVRCGPTGTFCLLVLFCFLNFSPVWGDPEKQEAKKKDFIMKQRCVCVRIDFKALSHIISNLIATISCNITVPTLL